MEHKGCMEGILLAVKIIIIKIFSTRLQKQHFRLLHQIF
jgi:hypothetical protein